MPVGAGADEERRRPSGDVLRRHIRQQPLHLDLGFALRQIEILGKPLTFWNASKKGVDIGRANAGQHVDAVVLGQWQVAHGVPIGLRSLVVARSILNSSLRRAS